MSDEDLQHDAALPTWLTLDERPGPAARLSKDRSAALVESALDAWQLEAAAGTRKSAAPVWRALATAAVVLLALITSGAAARWVYVALIAPSSSKPPAAAAPAAPQHARAAKPKIAAVAAPTAAVLVADIVEEAAPSVPAKPAERASKDALREPEDLMQQANRLRAQGRFAEAAQTYKLVYERNPGSVSAYVASVAAGSIELEHRGNPARARQLFTRALRAMPDAALDIEARQGLALALADLGERRAEADALTGLIAAHPKSPAAERARARLRELVDTHH